MIDRDTILMIWSGKSVTLNSESSYIANVVFDDTFTVIRRPLAWRQFSSE